MYNITNILFSNQWLIKILNNLLCENNYITDLDSK